MGRLRRVLGFQARAYWRRIFRPESTARKDLMLVAVLAAVFATKYAAWLRMAASDANVLRILLGAVWLGGLVTLSEDRQLALAPRRLRGAPFSWRELFALRVGCLLVPPPGWLLLAGSLAVAWPLHGSPAIVFYTASAWAAGIAVAAGFWPALLLCAAAFTPAPVWIMLRAPWLTVPLCLACGAMAYWSFVRSLRHPGGERAHRKSARQWIPGRMGALVQKDLRYARRWLDVYLGFVIAIPFSIYLATTAEPSRDAYEIGLFVIVLTTISVASNCFGLDSPGALDRYALFPLRGEQILRAKNIALAAVAGLQVAAPAVLGVLHFGAVVFVAALAGVAAMLVVSLAWGNYVSVVHPMRVQFYRFSSGGPVIPGVLGLVMTALPGLVVIAVGREAPGKEALVGLAMAGICGALYVGLLPSAGRRLEARFQHVRAWLT